LPSTTWAFSQLCISAVYLNDLRASINAFLGVIHMTETITFLKRREVQRKTTLPRSTMDREIALGTFPSPVRLTSGRSIAWVSTAVDKWIADRIAASATA
jgi:predicted DNA-binding transcriptional regulator AlpA